MIASEQRVYDDLANSPFDQFMGFDIAEISQDGLTLVFHNVGTAWDNPNGTLYGGVFYGMAASATEKMCLLHGLKPRLLDLAVNHIRPGKADTDIAVKTFFIHEGRTTAVAVCEFFDNEKRRLAYAKATFTVKADGGERL